jgi:hypothetical protein
MNVKAIETFVEYCNTHIKGDEKGEAQIFLDRFLQLLAILKVSRVLVQTLNLGSGTKKKRVRVLPTSFGPRKS